MMSSGRRLPLFGVLMVACTVMAGSARAQSTGDDNALCVAALDAAATRIETIIRRLERRPTCRREPAPSRTCPQEGDCERRAQQAELAAERAAQEVAALRQRLDEVVRERDAAKWRTTTLESSLGPHVRALIEDFRSELQKAIGRNKACDALNVVPGDGTDVVVAGRHHDAGLVRREVDRLGRDPRFGLLRLSVGDLQAVAACGIPIGDGFVVTLRDDGQINSVLVGQLRNTQGDLPAKVDCVAVGRLLDEASQTEPRLRVVDGFWTLDGTATPPEPEQCRKNDNGTWVGAGPPITPRRAWVIVRSR